MEKNFFRSGALNVHELVHYGMGPESQGLMCESTPSKPNPAQVPDPLPASPIKPELMTESAKDKAFFEAVDAKVLQDDRGMAAASILDWAAGTEHTADSLDALAASLAGIDTDSDADITDDDVDNYNYWLGLLADAAVAMGADQEDVVAAFDDDDDDAASVLADIAAGSEDALLESVTQHQFTSDSCVMFESTKKVVRAGKVVLIKKRPRPRRLTAKQRNALKKNARYSHTAAANLKRLKSMRKRKAAGL